MDDTTSVTPSPVDREEPDAGLIGASGEIDSGQSAQADFVAAGHSGAVSTARVSPRTTGRRLASGCLTSLSWLTRAALLVLLLLGVFFSLFPNGRAALRGTLLVPAVLLPNKTTPLTATGSAVRHSTMVVTARSGPVYLDVYEPADSAPPLPGAREGVVVIPGIGDERKDSQ
ncbi:MAG TPA: hypothetical protein VFS83_08920, partial [Ktedonobacterales bacterium]|nr:hypothetical protein [Ktedonobacterales bacterium]